jgi:DNA recombination protein RmuC
MNNFTTNSPILTIGTLELDTLSLLIGGLAGAFFIGIILLERFQASNKKTAHKIAVLEEEKFSLSQDWMREKTQREALQEQAKIRNNDEKLFEAQFENLAHKIFDEKTNKFKHQSKESLDQILSPLKDKLQDFQKKVDDSFGDQAKEQFALKEQIKAIVEANDKITLQAENLASALKGDSKSQGDWGEVMLERILEDSGLRKDVDYVKQGAGMGIKNSETGAPLKPDFIINLPEEKHVIIDSKVSLTHYERWHSEDNDIAREAHLKDFLNSVRQHVKDLEKRRYQDTDQLGTPDFVLMFMPIESAYMLALQSDRELHSFAWDKGVAIVCPSTLFSSLRTISSLWRLVLQNQNAIEIAQKGGALYDKVVGFVGDMQVIGNNLKTLDGNYHKALNKLSEGRGSVLSRTQNLKELGAKASKSLPSELLHDDLENPILEESTLIDLKNKNSSKVA